MRRMFISAHSFHEEWTGKGDIVRVKLGIALILLAALAGAAVNLLDTTAVSRIITDFFYGPNGWILGGVIITAYLLGSAYVLNHLRFRPPGQALIGVSVLMSGYLALVYWLVFTIQ